MNQLRNLAEAQSPTTTFVIGASLVIGFGVIDYVTGPQIAFSVFYLLPISYVEWRAGIERATVIAVLASIVWIVAEIGGGQTYSDQWIPVWNTTTRVLIFLIVVHLLDGLRQAADHDPLTGVLNARGFTQAAEKTLAESTKRGWPFTVAYVDLDDFKSINDHLGHSGGDDALKLVADALQTQVRSTDLVGRLGGDEFGVLFPATGSTGALSALDGLVERVRARVTDMPVKITFSAGAVTYLVPPGSIDDIVKTADELMYRAKNEGKDRYLHLVIGDGYSNAVPDKTPPRERALSDA